MSLKMETLSTKVLTMDFFDRLQEKKVIESSGSIRGCYEESYAGILVKKPYILTSDWPL